MCPFRVENGISSERAVRNGVLVSYVYRGISCEECYRSGFLGEMISCRESELLIERQLFFFVCFF